MAEEDYFSVKGDLEAQIISLEAAIQAAENASKNSENNGIEGEASTGTGDPVDNVEDNTSVDVDGLKKELEGLRNTLAIKLAAVEKARQTVSSFDGTLASIDAAKTQLKSGIDAAEDGKLFGSVSSKEIAQAAKEQLDLEIDKKKLVLPTPIKAVGTTMVPIKLHPKVTGELKVIVQEI